MKDEKLYRLALNFVPGIGCVHAKHLISYCGSAKAVFQASKGKLKNIPGIGLRVTEAFSDKDEYLRLAAEEYEKASKEQVNILHFTDKAYPDRLKRVMDAPAILYFKGNADLNDKKCVAIVGTREATEYGREAVEMIIDGLAGHNALIISGLAYGIDIHAHKTALKRNLPTIGVMASGINIIYPAVHRSTARRMEENGGLVTEYAFNEKPDAHCFPARNRIIAGMSDAVIVVEAARRGGALITAEIANSYHRDVFAVPGDFERSHSKGCNNLIRSHKAHILTEIADLEYVMNWDPADENKSPATESYDRSDFSDEETRIIDALIHHSVNREALIDDLSWKSQIPVNRLASLLLTLEFKGVVKSLPGKKFKLV